MSFPMGTQDIEVFQQLLDQMKIMNEHLHTASTAINTLTQQLSSCGISPISSILPQMDNENAKSNTAKIPCADTSGHGDQATHALGYVNWDDSCMEYNNLHLVKMVHIRNALKKLQVLTPRTSTTGRQSMIGYGYVDEEDCSDQTKANTNGLFKFTLGPVIGKEDRFPQDAVYLDINSPIMKKEMDFMNNLNVPPTEGVFDRFLNLIESEKMTFAVFEKKFGLKWVD